MEKSWNFVYVFEETTSIQKTSCQTHTTCVSDREFSGYWWFQVLIIANCMHGLQACLFKYITVAAFCIYLSVVKMLLKGEVGGHALNIMEITLLIMENHGIVFFEFLWEPCYNKWHTFTKKIVFLVRWVIWNSGAKKIFLSFYSFYLYWFAHI